MTVIKVFLDDRRPTPEGWIRVYTAEQCMALLQTRIVNEISFDNDLGEGQTEGYIALNFLEELATLDPTFPIPRITIHSSNAGRTPSMRQTAAKLKDLKELRELGATNETSR